MDSLHGVLLLGLVVFIWLFFKSSKEKNILSKLNTELSEEKIRLQSTLQFKEQSIDQLQKWIETSEQRFKESFANISREVFQQNSKNFLDHAKIQFENYWNSHQTESKKREEIFFQSMSPLKESLEKVDLHISQLELKREGAYQSLMQNLTSMHEVNKELRGETSKLVRALRTPGTRGRWGEIQLKRVVEMAGMLAHCDFYEQVSAQTEYGAKRPDLLVRLPGEKHIVVDAKVPLAGYLEAIDATSDSERDEKMRLHAEQLKKHIQLLGQKAYWDQFQPSPEFVVLYLPSEAIYTAALEKEPELLELGVSQKVLIATPTSLIALLRAVAFGWRHEKLQESAQKISEHGKELYERLCIMSSYFSEIGKNLQQSVGSYNKAVGSFESRVLVSARKFEELLGNESSKELVNLNRIDTTPREILAPKS